MSSKELHDLLAQKGRQLYRPMPWRDDTRPYYVLVSEVMLQQTQVERVVPKFQQFIAQFPDEATLARSDLASVLRAWQGLGYNRRAKYLHEAAKAIVARGSFPSTYDELVQLPGVGKNTAGAILAYSFNQPALFVETNIRTVYLHHFFAGQTGISDTQIEAKLAETINGDNPRQFYWALMDYGTQLKAQGVRNIAASKHYTRQAPLKGSVREVRGQILQRLTGGQALGSLALDARFKKAVGGLQQDGLVTIHAGTVRLTR